MFIFHCDKEKNLEHMLSEVGYDTVQLQRLIRLQAVSREWQYQELSVDTA